ncbi:hypothetical protein ACWEO2_41980 [Nocardia sp. NPDC004278]
MNSAAPAGRPDDALRDLDVLAVIADGAFAPGDAPHPSFTVAAIVASYQLKELNVVPYAVRYLADCVRAMGINACAELSESLRGEVPARLARGWLGAACPPEPDIRRDAMFAR